MDQIHLENVLDFDKYNYKICSYYRYKNGFIKKEFQNYFINFNKLICLIKKKQKILDMYKFFYPDIDLIGLNNYDIIKELILLKYCENIKIKIYKFNNLYFYFLDNVELLSYYLVYLDNYFYKSKQKINDHLLAYFLYLKLANKDIQTIKIILFWEEYSLYIYRKYKINLKNFKNLNDYYRFLKKKGFVDKYYNNIIPKIEEKYKKIRKKLDNDKEFQKKVKIKSNEINKKSINFKIDNYFKKIDNLDDSFNKELIKNKFIELCKKYNI